MHPWHVDLMPPSLPLQKASCAWCDNEGISMVPAPEACSASKHNTPFYFLLFFYFVVSGVASGAESGELAGGVACSR